MEKRGFISVDYDEGDQSTYRGLDLSVRENEKDKEEVKFNTGNITIDYIDMTKYIDENNIEYVVFSSSWDHIFMDGDEMTTLSVREDGTIVTDAKELIYDDSDIMYYPIYKKDNIDTFEDLRKYYKDYKKL